jgi:outer membrane biosynthesis protein TonB
MIRSHRGDQPIALYSNGESQRRVPAGVAAWLSELNPATCDRPQSARLILGLSFRGPKREQRGDMLGIVQDSPTCSVSRGLLYVRVVVLSLLGALVFAASAHASGLGATSGGKIESAIPTPAEAPERGLSPEKGSPETGLSPSPEKGPPETAPVGPPPEKAPVEPAPVATLPEKAPAETVPVVIVPEKAPAEPVPVVTLPEKGPETPPASTVTETTQEAAPVKPVIEKGPEGPVSPPPPVSAPQVAATSSDAAGRGTLEVPSTLINSQKGTGGPPASSGTGSGSGGAQAAIAAGWARGFGCELSELNRRRTGTCITGGLDSQPVLPGLPLGLATAAASLTSGPPAGGGHGGSAGGAPPVSPGPGSAPSGVAGGSAMGGSGSSVSVFLTLAGLLLLAAPRAMRRLRLLCRPWLSACFVLIPERPG